MSTGLYVDGDGQTVRVAAIAVEKTFVYALSREEAMAFASAVIEAAHQAGPDQSHAPTTDLRLAQVGGRA